MMNETTKALMELRENGPFSRMVQDLEIPVEMTEMFDLAGKSATELQSIAAQSRDKGDWMMTFKAARELPLRSEARKGFLDWVKTQIEAIPGWENDKLLKAKRSLCC